MPNTHPEITSARITARSAIKVALITGFFYLISALAVERYKAELEWQKLERLQQLRQDSITTAQLTAPTTKRTARACNGFFVTCK